MANTYFGFKEFMVYQEHCAMKVCTDACLFGAWLADKVQTGALGEIKSALDIGLGTGVLSLMLAQKCDAVIDGVEIDELTIRQALSNFRTSPWEKRLNVFHQTIQRFMPAQSYNLVFSNPPFFEQHLKSSDSKRNLALHSEELKLDELVTSADRLLKPTGHFAVLLSYARTAAFIRMAGDHGLFLHDSVTVKQTPAHQPFRSMLLFGKTQVSAPGSTTITIKEGDEYTAPFATLLEDYYINI